VRVLCEVRLSIKFILIPDITWIGLTSFIIFRASLNWQALLCGKWNIKKNHLGLNWNTQLEISKKLYFKNPVWKHQNDLLTAIHFYFYNSEYTVLYTMQTLGLFITFFALVFFETKYFLSFFGIIVVNTLVSSPEIFPSCQTNIFL